MPRSLQKIKLEIPGDIWQMKLPQVASALQEHRVTVRQVLRQLVPRRIRICLALQGAPALHLPCKGARKALELLPNQPKAFSRVWVNSKSKVYITGAMSQDPKAFILGLDRSLECPKLPSGRVCKGNAPPDILRLTRVSIQRQAAKAVWVHS